MELEQTSLGGPPEWQGGTVSRPGRSRASVGATRHPSGSRALAPFLAAALLIGLALALTLYGVAATHDILALLGIAAAALSALSLVLGACASLRRLERRCGVLGRARAESERARHELEVENAELERRNASLEEEQCAIHDGFELMDEQTAGRLRALLEAAGCDLAELTDFVLDDPDDDA